MNTKQPTLANLRSRIRHGLLAAGLMMISLLTTQGQTLTWDANGGGAASDGSGTWHTVGDWWNGSSTANWLDGDIADIGAGVAGTYTITVDSAVTANEVLFTTSGYTLTGSALLSYTNGVAALPGAIGVAANVSAEIDCPIKNTQQGALGVAAGGTLTITGGFSEATGSPIMIGATAATSTLKVSGVTGTGGTGLGIANGFKDIGTWDVEGITVYITSNAVWNATSRVDIGRNSPAVVTVTNGGVLLVNQAGTGANSVNNSLQITRSVGGSIPSVVNVQNGGTIDTYAGATAGGYVRLSPDQNNEISQLNVFPGGVLSVGIGPTGSPGTTSSLLRPVTFLDNGVAFTTASAVFNISGGVVTASGIQFGGTGDTFTTATVAQLNISGRYTYLDAAGIYFGGPSFTNPAISLSGGVLAATANWSSVLPMTLGTGAGGITFQTADTNGTARNITLTGILTGAGGLTETGVGALTLSGADTFGGSDTVSSGELVVNAPSGLSIGAISVAAAATLSAQPPGTGDFWTCASLNLQTNSIADFNYASIPISASQSPVVTSGALQMVSSATVSVEGTGLFNGVYPLIKYGSFSGALPATLNVPNGVTATLSNDTVHTTIDLVVTGSPNNPPVAWNIGSGTWNTTSPNWMNVATHATTDYTDGDAVDFNDDGQPNPIVITLNSTVFPLSVAANNLTNNFTITGSGGIANNTVNGTTGVIVQGGGALTLATANTYSGGTLVNNSQLNINNAGNGSTSSAVGSGPLTLTNNAIIDNTTGSALTLSIPIQENWGNFTYAGSQANLNLGTGSVNLGQNVSLTVVSNMLTVGGSIVDNGNNFSLTKLGNGGPSLTNGSAFTGGVNLVSGQLNIDDPTGYALGSGPFTIDGGTIIDNTIGVPFTLQPVQMNWNGNFAFNGTTNLNLGTGEIGLGIVSGATLTLTVNSNILETDGEIDGLGKTIAKAGPGTWTIGGGGPNNGLTIIDNAGTIILAKASSASGYCIGYSGMTVNSNATAICAGTGSNQFFNSPLVPLTLNAGGLFDLAGTSQEIYSVLFNGGTLANSALSSQSLLTTESTGVTLGTNDACVFSIPAGSSLTLRDTVAIGSVSGAGSLVLTNGGTLNIYNTNTYTGNTEIYNGTLALLGTNGSISNQATIDLAVTNAALDLSQDLDSSGSTNPVLALVNGQTLSGFGVVTGLVVSVSGATVSPGSPTAVGTLTVTGNAGASSLGGITVMKLDPLAATNDVLSVSGSLVLGGTLSLPTLAGTLAAPQSYTLFQATGGLNGGFTSITPATPGAGLAWNTSNLLINGTISVKTGAVPAPPVFTSISLSGTTLTIKGTNGVPSGPYELLSSTNLTVPLTNWIPVLSSNFDGTGDFNISISNSIPANYFILSQP